jgi:hypothetical protein
MSFLLTFSLAIPFSAEKQACGLKFNPSSACLFRHFFGILLMGSFQMYSLPALDSGKRSSY